MNYPKDQHEMSKKKIAQTMFLGKNTVANIEKRALEKMRKIFQERGISAKDILPN